MKKATILILMFLVIVSIVNAFKPEHVKINEQLTSACGVNSVYCD